jgi:predicted transcriptional regulator
MQISAPIITTIMGVQTKESMIVKILELSKHGATMTKLTHDLSMTHRQLRRIMAELVDRGFLRFTFTNQGYITTQKGYIFLNRSKTKTRYSQSSRKIVTTREVREETKESIDLRQRNRSITTRSRKKEQSQNVLSYRYIATFLTG